MGTLKLDDDEREVEAWSSLLSKLEKRMKKLDLARGSHDFGGPLILDTRPQFNARAPQAASQRTALCNLLRCSVQKEGLCHHWIKPTCDRTKIANAENQTAGKTPSLPVEKYDCVVLVFGLPVAMRDWSTVLVCSG